MTNRDKTRLEEFSDEELEAVAECERSLLVEAELKKRYCRWQIAVLEEEKEFRRSRKPRRPAKEWENLWHREVEDVAATCGVSLGYVAEIALKVARET
jgi:hypothetical protein